MITAMTVQTCSPDENLSIFTLESKERLGGGGRNRKRLSNLVDIYCKGPGPLTHRSVIVVTGLPPHKPKRCQKYFNTSGINFLLLCWFAGSKIVNSKRFSTRKKVLGKKVS